MKRRQTIAAILSALLALQALAGCSSTQTQTSGGEESTSETEQSSATEPGTFPISEEPITLKIMVPISANHSKSLGDLEMIQEYEKMANVHVEWDEVSEQAYNERYKLVLASNELPDAFGSGFSYDGSIVYRYAKEGLIIPLEDLIESSTVNMKKYFNEREDFRKLCTYPDGHIYALPSIDENQNIRMGNFIAANYTFLEKLGMDVPETIDELEEYLRAATSTDLNGDGKNEIGLSFNKTDPTITPNKITRMFSMFGVSWEPNTYLHYTGEGDFVFAPTMKETREALEYFHTWYADGLIDQEIFTQDAAQLKAKGTDQGVALGIASTYPELNGSNAEKNEYHLIPAPKMSNGEDGIWYRDGLIPGFSANQFFITNVNQYPAETLRYIDYWMDNSVNALTNRFGPEGYSWEWIDEENGVWTETATIPSGETRDMKLSTLYCTWGYGIPYWCFGDFWSQKEITVDNALERGAIIRDSYINVASPGLPAITYEESDNREALTIKTDLFKYIDSEIANFLTQGVTDESWNAYVQKCRDLQSERWVELYSTYYMDMYGES